MRTKERDGGTTDPEGNVNGAESILGGLSGVAIGYVLAKGFHDHPGDGPCTNVARSVCFLVMTSLAGFSLLNLAAGDGEWQLVSSIVVCICVLPPLYERVKATARLLRPIREEGGEKLEHLALLIATTAPFLSALAVGCLWFPDGNLHLGPLSTILFTIALAILIAPLTLVPAAAEPVASLWWAALESFFTLPLRIPALWSERRAKRFRMAYPRGPKVHPSMHALHLAVIVIGGTLALQDVWRVPTWPGVSLVGVLVAVAGCWPDGRTWLSRQWKWRTGFRPYRRLILGDFFLAALFVGLFVLIQPRGLSHEGPATWDELSLAARLFEAGGYGFLFLGSAALLTSLASQRRTWEAVGNAMRTFTHELQAATTSAYRLYRFCGPSTEAFAAYQTLRWGAGLTFAAIPVGGVMTDSAFITSGEWIGMVVAVPALVSLGLLYSGGYRASFKAMWREDEKRHARAVARTAIPSVVLFLASGPVLSVAPSHQTQYGWDAYGFWASFAETMWLASFLLLAASVSLALLWWFKDLCHEERWKVQRPRSLAGPARVGEGRSVTSRRT